MTDEIERLRTLVQYQGDQLQKATTMLIQVSSMSRGHHPQVLALMALCAGLIAAKAADAPDSQAELASLAHRIGQTLRAHKSNDGEAEASVEQLLNIVSQASAQHLESLKVSER